MKFKTLHFLLFGDMHKPVNDLHKQQTKEEKLLELNQLIQKYFYLIALASILFCLILFVVVCFHICGISATESGMMRNFLNGGI